MFRELVLGAAGAFLLACAASAHVTLETREAPVGAPYKAVLRVAHGCEGTATIALRIRVPDGMIAVKPMPKPGWKIETVSGKYPKAYSFFRDEKLSEGVLEISFSGGNLPDSIMTSSCSAAFSPATSNRARCFTFRSCRNAKRACTAGSRFRRQENQRAIIPSPRLG